MSIISHEEEVYQKVQSFCAYRERCSFEVKQKLRRMGVNNAYIEKTINKLKTEGFLNDERFTKIYVRSKVYNNNWGKSKIRYYLKQLNIPQDYITKAFNDLDEEEYNNNLKKIIAKRFRNLNEDDLSIKKNKTANYCIQKGFEGFLVWQLINETL